MFNINLIPQAFAFDADGGALPPQPESLSHPLPLLQKLIGDNTNVGKVFGDLLTSVISLATMVAGIMLVLYLVYGGVKYVTAGGSEKAVDEAKRMITNAIIGLIIVVAAIMITQLVGKILGFENILGPSFLAPGEATP